MNTYFTKEEIQSEKYKGKNSLSQFVPFIQGNKNGSNVKVSF